MITHMKTVVYTVVVYTLKYPSDKKKKKNLKREKKKSLLKCLLFSGVRSLCLHNCLKNQTDFKMLYIC